MSKLRSTLLLTSVVGLLLTLAAACSCLRSSADAENGSDRTPVAPVTPLAEGQAEAVFAGGCFWCMEAPFDTIDGVISTTSGYAGGEIEHPTYSEVSAGRTRHLEVIRIVYDPARVTYARLLDVYWHNVDPTDRSGQFCDRGAQYGPAIFVQNAEERRLAEESRDRAQAALSARGIGDRIVTPIVDGGPFYSAEAYHQDFYQRNPGRYQQYRRGCGRDRRLQELWGASGH